MEDLKSMITTFMLNVNGLSTLIKRLRVSDWIKKQDWIFKATKYCLPEMHLKYKQN